MVKCLIALGLLLIASVVTETKAECCMAMAHIHHVCAGIPFEREMEFHSVMGWIDENWYWIRDKSDQWKPKCESFFCGDGTKMQFDDFFCGNGQCNIFGCNCDNGCRQKENVTEESITNAFVTAFGFTEKAQHRMIKLPG